MPRHVSFRTAALALGLALFPGPGLFASGHAVAGETQCDAIDAVPVQHAIDYTTQIRPIFPRYGCIDCHSSTSPTFDLDLSGANFHELCGLVGVFSQIDPARTRIEPGEPMSSVLYVKMACDDTPGSRMPLGGGRVSLADLALLRDWIREGAVAADAECSGTLSTGFESQVRD